MWELARLHQRLVRRIFGDKEQGDQACRFRRLSWATQVQRRSPRWGTVGTGTSTWIITARKLKNQLNERCGFSLTSCLYDPFRG